MNMQEFEQNVQSPNITKLRVKQEQFTSQTAIANNMKCKQLETLQLIGIFRYLNTNEDIKPSGL